MNKSLILLITLGLNCLSVFSQVYQTRHFTTKDGLPDNNIRDIYKDSRKIMWVGTDAGLCQFDGNSFTLFNLGNKNQVNKVWAIEEDGGGNMWFGTYGSGLFKYDGKKIIHFEAPTITNNHIRVLKYSHRHKSLFIGTEFGFTILKDSTFTKFSQKDSNSQERINVMGVFENDDSLFIHTYRNGMYLFNPRTETLNPLDPNHQFYQHSSSGSIVTQRGDVLQGISKNGLSVINDSISKNYKDIGQIFDFTEDANGHVWIAAWSYYDMQEPGGFFQLKGDNLIRMNKKLGVSSSMALSLYFDSKSNSMWMGTNGEGLFLYQENGITYFKADYFGVPTLNIHDILIDNNQLIIGADKLLKGNEKDGFKVYDGEFFIENSIGGYTNHKKCHLPDSITQFLHLEKDSRGNLWVGTNEGLFRQNENQRSINFYDRLLWETQCFTITNNGTLYGGGWNWHLRVNNVFSDTLNYKEYSQDLSKPRDVNRIIQRDDELWFSSWAHGIHRYKNEEYRWINELDSLFPRNIKDLSMDKAGDLIAGTNDGKVLIFDYNDRIKIKYYLSNESGLIGNSINCLHVTKSNNLWISTNTALNVLSLDDLYKTGKPNVRYFDADEGFTELEVRIIEEDIEGNLWFGGENSLVKINPEQLLRTEQTTQIKLSKILVNNKTFDWTGQEIDVQDWDKLPKSNFELDHLFNSFVFEFKTNNLINPDKDRFAVKLEGFDKEFCESSKEDKSVYTNLNPGKYILHIRGENLQTGLEYVPFQISFTIKPPWFQTWWFRLLAITSIISGIWTLLIYKSRKIRQKTKQKHEIEKEITHLKVSAIQAQMNPHFIFNAISSVQNYMLSNDNEAAMDYLVLFANLIRKTMDLVSEQMIPLADELTYLESYIQIENMRFEDGILYELNMDPSIDTDDLMIPPLLLQPFIENAIKHGLASSKDEKKLELNISSNNHSLQISIKDNGIGRKQSAQHKRCNGHASKGLHISEKRLQYMDSTITNGQSTIKTIDHYEGNRASGTEVLIHISVVS